MQKPGEPCNESTRIQELHDLDILDTPREKVFDDITELAALICEAPYALVNFIDELRAWPKSGFGFSDLPVLPRESSICSHCVLTEHVLEIRDTATHPLFSDQAACGKVPQTRFYAGVPLITGKGHAIGVLCVFGPTPKSLTPGQTQALRKLAATTMDLIESRRTEQAVRHAVRNELAMMKIINSAGEGLFALDAQGRCVIANITGARMCGWKPEELIDKPMHEVMHYRRADGKPYPDALCPIQTTLRDGESRRSDKDVFWRRDGTSFPVEYAAHPIKRDGVITGAVVTFKDISERRATESALRRLTEHLQRSKENERTRLARKIHDELGGPLAAIKFELAAGDPQAASATPPTNSVRLIDNAINALRRIMSELRPSVLDDIGVSAAIEWLFTDCQETTGIACTVDVDEMETELAPEMATAIFRIVQEALANAVQHAQATQIDIFAHRENGHLEIVISDDGIGVDDEKIKNSSGYGLIHMRERAEAIGATLTVTPSPDGGTTVTLDLSHLPTPPRQS